MYLVIVFDIMTVHRKNITKSITGQPDPTSTNVPALTLYRTHPFNKVEVPVIRKIKILQTDRNLRGCKQDFRRVKGITKIYSSKKIGNNASRFAYLQFRPKRLKRSFRLLYTLLSRVTLCS
ncbi:hypothetical protein Hanom_Chr13g01192211 [Helianthus anomalus]